MFKHTKLVYYLWVIIALVWSASAMDDEDDPYANRYNTAPASSLNNADQSGDERILTLHNTTSPTTSLIETDNATLTNLKEYFNPTILTVIVPKTAKQIIGGVCAAVASFCSGQVGAPLSLGGVGEIGLTPEILPFSVELVVGAAALPVATTAVAAYKGATELLSVRSPELIAAQERITHRQYSRLESLVYSPVNKFLQLMLFGGLMAAIISNFESNVTGWGPTIVWSVFFSLFFLIPTYFNNVAATNNPDKHPYRHHESEDAKKNLKDCVKVVKTVKEAVKDGDLDHTKNLASQMNILFAAPAAPVNERSPLVVQQTASQADSNQGREDAVVTVLDNGAEGGLTPAQLRLNEEAALEDRERGITDALEDRMRSIQELTLQDPNRPRYLKVWDEMVKIYKLIPETKKMREKTKEKVALFLSDGIQILGYPMRTLTTFGLTYKLLNLGFSHNVSLGGGIAGAVLMAIPNALGSYKEIPLTRDEFLDIMNFYAPDSVPYWGGRIPMGIAVVGTVVYFILPIEVYLRHSILEDVVGITSLGWQLALVTPFLAGTIFAQGRQFFSKNLSWISERFKFQTSDCCDPLRRLTRGEDLLTKLKELEEKTLNMNPNAAHTLRHQLNMNRE